MIREDDDRRHPIRAEGSHSRIRPATSYYDLYPERKRTGPYIPKHTLVAHGPDTVKEGISSSSRHSALRKSRSGSQLESRFSDAAGSTHVRHAGALLQAPRPLGKGDDQSKARPPNASSSTDAARAVARSQSRMRNEAREPVKSIEEIVRTYSSNLLDVPPPPRGPQRSASWSAFDHCASPRESSRTTSPQEGAISDASSVSSVDSVERETRTVLQSTEPHHLERIMSNLSAGSSQSNHDRKRHVGGHTHSGRLARPGRSPPNPSDLNGLSPKRRGLTCCAHITIPGAAAMQVSFADVGDENGRPVIVFLGLGASRHLVGLYDELATSLGLRLICIDRWGIGRTDGVSPDSRTILGWSLIVEKVADLLHIDKFAMLAHSAGAPFAAAVALLFPDRVEGPVRFLAPWAGMQQDSGYRWLRYVPDGFIKTAQAAEWKLQTWRLGREGSRANSKTPLNSSDDEFSRDQQLELRGDGRSADVASQRATGQQEGSSRRAIDSDRPNIPAYSRALASEEAEREGAVALLNASRTESARGLVDDLNLVLGKKPWGFDYADVQVACEVWHGSKDERIPLSSSVSLAKEMRNCSLRVIDGASHSLMTNSSVVVEVFERIRKDSSKL